MMRIISILVVLVNAFFSFSQKPYVELILEPEHVEEGQAFTVVVKSNVSGQINIDFPEEFESGYNVMNSMEQEIDANSGETITFFFHGRSGQIKKEGKYSFGPAYIKKGNKVYKSNKARLIVSSQDANPNETIESSLIRKPACGAIVLSKDKIYVGEPVRIESQINARFEPTHYDGYQSYEIEPSADRYKLEAPKNVVVDTENSGSKKRYSFSLDKQVVFFNNPGKYKVNPFAMTLQSGIGGYQVVSKRNKITVVPLPKDAPTAFNGAVGSYTIASNLENLNLKQGEISTFVLTISGYGNLHDLSNPVISWPKEIKLYGDPERLEKIKFTERGAEGLIQIKYNLQPQKEGEIKIPAVAFAFFDPSTETYITKYSTPARMQVEKDPAFVLEASKKAENSSSHIERYTSNSKENESLFRHPAVKWIGISTPFCLAFLFLMFKRKKKEEVEKNEKTALTGTPILEKIDKSVWLSQLRAHAETGNTLLFFTQLSKSLQSSVSQASTGDINWVLSQDEIKAFFSSKEYPQQFQTEFFGLQQTCELCRYGCQEPHSDLFVYVAKAESIFDVLQNENPF